MLTLIEDTLAEIEEMEKGFLSKANGSQNKTKIRQKSLHSEKEVIPSSRYIRQNLTEGKTAMK